MSVATVPKCLAIGVALAVSTTYAQSPTNPLHLHAHHITASVADIDRATAWYQKMLGFSLQQRGKHGAIDFVELTIPGFGVSLIRDPTMLGTASQQINRPHWIHIAFAVPDPDATYHSLLSKGASVSLRDGAPRNPVSGFLVNDSEGNEIEIVRESST